MRAFFLFLLLANLLFLAWTHWVVAPVRESTASTGGTQSAGTTIQLRRELATDVVAVAAGSDPVAATCVSLGPFLRPADAAATAQRMEQLGFVAHARAAVDDISVGPWVRVPQLATPDEAVNAVAALRLVGFARARVDDGNAVFVGVFADRAQAERAAERAGRIGYAAETTDRTRSAEVVWLDFARHDNGSLPTLEAVQVDQGSTMQLELRACPATSEDEIGTPASGGGEPSRVE